MLCHQVKPLFPSPVSGVNLCLSPPGELVSVSPLADDSSDLTHGWLFASSPSSQSVFTLSIYRNGGGDVWKPCQSSEGQETSRSLFSGS